MLDPAVNAREMEYVQYEVGTPASYPLVGAEAKIRWWCSRSGS